MVVAGWLLGAGTVLAQEIRDRKTLEVESAKVVRLGSEGQYAEALPIARRVAQAAEQLYGTETETAIHLNRLALLYQAQGEYAQAEHYFQRSLHIREAKLGKKHPEVAASLNNLAFLYLAMDQYAKAEQHFLSSLTIFEARHDKDELAVGHTLNNLAFLYQKMGQYAKAEPLYLRSLRIRETKLGQDHLHVAQSLNNLAALYQDMGQYAKAEPLYLRSLTIYENKQHPDVAKSLHSLAELYRALGQYAKAEPLYLRCLHIRETKLGQHHPDVAQTLNSLAGLYRALGQYAKAEPLYLRCLQIRQVFFDENNPAVAQSLNNLAGLFEATEQTARAADLTDRARRISRRHMTSVLTVVSEQEQANFLRRRDELNWHQALSLGLRHPDDEPLAERSAAWLLNAKSLAQQTLAQTGLLKRDSRDPNLRDLSQRLFQTRQELARLTLNPPQARQLQQRQLRLNELNQREQDLAKQLRQAGGASGDASWVELDQVRQKLPADTVLIELARFGVFDFQAVKDQKKWQPARYAAWIIPARGPVRVVDLGPADAMDALVQLVRRALQDADKEIRRKGEAEAETAVRQPLEALAQRVLYPLLPYVGQAPRWVVSPDSNLWLVPWAALPLPDGKFAVENHTISYVVSGRDLLDAAPANVQVTAPLVLADPDFDLALEARRLPREQEVAGKTRGLTKGLRLGAIKPLPYTATEAAAITADLHRYAKAAPRVLTDKDATTSAFLATRNPRVVVLSTHGYFLPDQEVAANAPDRLGTAGSPPDGLLLDNPLLRCGLLLAGCNNADRAREGGDNGVLTGLQIVGTDLRGCELVVLSACETGLGEVRNGAGVAGLRQAFQMAGAQSVVATLWQVPDLESAQLMIGFFGNLAAQQSKAEALRKAQLALIKARRDKTAAAHPFYWAAYTVTGR
jgi:CHAT domain-containing protein